MLNPFKEVNWKPGRAEKRQFARSLMIGFPIVALLIFVARGALAHVWTASFPLTLGGIGFGAGLLLWLMPGLAAPFYIVWYGFGCCLGIVIGNVLLSLFYFVVVTGLGLFLRALGKCPISKRPDPAVKSYWRDAGKVTDVERYYRQF